MRVRILRNVAKHPDWTEGSEQDLSEAEAADLLRQGLAETIEPHKAVPQKTAQAVPPRQPDVPRAKTE